jgi:hypothetical protein
VRVHVGDIFDLGLWTLDDQAPEEIGRREDAVRGRHGAGDGQARTANGHAGRKDHSLDNEFHGAAARGPLARPGRRARCPMTTATRDRRTPAYESAELPTRQLTWTRLGNTMGYTNTKGKRSEIRAAIEATTWRDPAELVDVLDSAPARQVIAFVLGGRRWTMQRATITTLPAADPLRPVRRVLGIESVSGRRYVLLDDGYEWLHLYTDRPVHERVGGSG